MGEGMTRPPGSGGGALVQRSRRTRTRDGRKMAEVLQRKLQSEVEKYQAVQKDLSKCLSARQKLEAQVTENTIVKEELDLLESTNSVFKLIGPVLVRQDLEEAKSTVAKRLEYINGEIKRYEGQMKELEKKSEQQRTTLAKLQQDFQKAQGKTPVKV